MTFPPESPLLLEDSISFSTMSDVLERREQLIEYIWGVPELPTRNDLFSRNDAIQTSEYDFSPRANLASIDEMWIEMDLGMHSGVYLFHPTESNGCLFIYHAGHNPSPGAEDYYNRMDDPPEPGVPPYGLVIPALIRCGFTVLSMSMPIVGAWRNPTVEGVVVTTHDQLFEMVENPWPFFVDPVHRFLNLLAPQFQCISMMGLSGGGWTTTICAAIDPRIHRSYPVAGSVPIWLRPDAEGLGDAEQVHPEFYSIANYTELYVMGSVGTGRRQLQILNEHDPCCFSGTRHTQWVPKVKAAVATLGYGSYDFYMDQDTTRHRVTRASLARILLDHAEFLSMDRLTKIVSEDQ